MSSHPEYNTNSLIPSVHRVRSLVHSVKSSFLGNERAIDLMAACCIAGQPLMLLGEPGSGKTTMSVAFFQRMGLKRGEPDGFFEKCFHPYIEPSDVYGPLDYNRLTGGGGTTGSEYVRLVDGYLPSARAAFLDDVFAASPEFLLTFLSILESRVYHNGRQLYHSPLHMILGAANELPTQSRLRAIVNRFPIRVIAEEFSGVQERARVLQKSAQLWRHRAFAREAAGNQAIVVPQGQGAPVAIIAPEPTKPVCSFEDFMRCSRAIVAGFEVPGDFHGQTFVQTFAACLECLAKHQGHIASPNARTQQKVYEVVRALALLRRENPEPQNAELRVLEHIFDTPEAQQHIRQELDQQGVPKWTPLPP